MSLPGLQLKLNFSGSVPKVVYRVGIHPPRAWLQTVELEPLRCFSADRSALTPPISKPSGLRCFIGETTPAPRPQAPNFVRRSWVYPKPETSNALKPKPDTAHLRQVPGILLILVPQV